MPKVVFWHAVGGWYVAWEMGMIFPVECGVVPNTKKQGDEYLCTHHPALFCLVIESLSEDQLEPATNLGLPQLLDCIPVLCRVGGMAYALGTGDRLRGVRIE